MTLTTNYKLLTTKLIGLFFLTTNYQLPTTKFLVVLFLTTIYLLLAPTAAEAATLYWVGNDGAATNVASNWKTTDPATCGSGDQIIL